MSLLLLLLLMLALLLSPIFLPVIVSFSIDIIQGCQFSGFYC
jgi:hypothetical protein